MVWPHPRDVILYARSSYYYDIMIIICPFLTFFLILKPVLIFNPKDRGNVCHNVTFLDVTSCFPSLVPCLKLTLCNVATKNRQPMLASFKRIVIKNQKTSVS